MNFDFDAITDRLASALSEERFLHSLGVTHKSLMLATRHWADPERAAVAGLVHDCAKGFGREELLNAVEKHNLNLGTEDLEYIGMLHAPVGAVVAETEYSITDPEVLDAIRYHPCGRANPSLTLQILMMADYCEPTRDYSWANKAREALKDELRTGLRKILAMKLDHIRSRGRTAHSRSLEMLASLEN